MGHFYSIDGQRAFSDFRMQKLAHDISAIDAKAQAVTAQNIYLINARQALSQEELNKLTKLLLATETVVQAPENQQAFWVVPRLGTISPWASKASDIVHNCGMSAVISVEKAIRFDVQYSGIGCTEPAWLNLLHDRMTQSVLRNVEELKNVFSHGEPEPLNTIPVAEMGRTALEQANQSLGLALATDEIDYLLNTYQSLQRDPTDVELMMFAQANSEHCRHKIFTGEWIIDGQKQDMALFPMIKNTKEKSPEGVLSAYHDNSSVIKGSTAARFFAQTGNVFEFSEEEIDILMKVETHNHPTAIAPFAGAATGAGGEIRDEGATGRGAKPKAGLAGYTVSNLHIPGRPLPWELDASKPEHIASALDIMIAGPIGAASYNNEFGRPNLCGYFRSYEQVINTEDGAQRRGYHKPIMIAGGLGNIRNSHIQKNDIPAGSQVVVLGGPAMLIGLGGGAASSMASGSSDAELDFASVQRDNPEIERRCQEVIDRAWAMGDNNPIESIHDVGAGGISNAVPEILNDAGRGGKIQLRKVDCADPSLSPMAIWCNESQERYVIAIAPQNIALFSKICARERCPFAVIGEATDDGHLSVEDSLFNNKPVDLDMQILLGKPPKMLRDVTSKKITGQAFSFHEVDVDESLRQVLQHPTVADKTFLITIGDRTVGGMTARDQLVGPWQIPVADVAVTTNSFTSYQGEAMAMGERTPVANLNAPASGRMAIAEAITNIAAADIKKLSDIKLSANWMAACGYPGEDVNLYETVKTVGMELCPALGIAIPVGKDSLSMRSKWQDKQGEHEVVSPLSLIISAFAPVSDVRKTLTPQLRNNKDTSLLFIDLAEGEQRLGGSIFSHITNQLGDDTPDLDNPERLKQFFAAMHELKQQDLLLAYHDRSDGGLWATLCEMAFAGRTGLSIDVSLLGTDLLPTLLNEEIGCVLQVANKDILAVKEIFNKHNLLLALHEIGTVQEDLKIDIAHSGKHCQFDLLECQQLWSQTSYHIQRLRDNPECAQQAYENIKDKNNTGLYYKSPVGTASYTARDRDSDVKMPKPRVAILREQGVNGQLEMAASFTLAGFEATDVHMQDLLDGTVNLQDFKGLAACGGFSYGDVLGAGQGWAQTILFHEALKEQFRTFFHRSDTFTLGVCNGCQMLATLKDLIPGAAHWPKILRNTSEQYEARLVMTQVNKSSSVLLKGLQGMHAGIVVSHAEGRMVFEGKANNIAVQYVDPQGKTTQRYPYNPNGTLDAIAGLTNDDGRVTIMMPHPERVIRTVQMSWHPDNWDEFSPWFKIFQNAYDFVS